MISKKRKIRKTGLKNDIFSSVFLVVLLIAVVVFLLFSNIRISRQRKEMAEKTDRLRTQVELLEETNKQLQEGILQTESDIYWESRLYEQGYVKPGEESIVILPPPEEEEIEISEEKDFIQNIIDWVLMRY